MGEDSDDQEDRKQKERHRNMFNDPEKNIFLGEDSEYSSDSESEENDQMEHNLFTSQNFYNQHIDGN